MPKILNIYADQSNYSTLRPEKCVEIKPAKLHHKAPR